MKRRNIPRPVVTVQRSNRGAASVSRCTVCGEYVRVMKGRTWMPQHGTGPDWSACVGGGLKFKSEEVTK